jgi:hypothetical protein
MVHQTRCCPGQQGYQPYFIASENRHNLQAYRHEHLKFGDAPEQACRIFSHSSDTGSSFSRFLYVLRTGSAHTRLILSSLWSFIPEVSQNKNFFVRRQAAFNPV